MYRNVPILPLFPDNGEESFSTDSPNVMRKYSTFDRSKPSPFNTTTTNSHRCVCDPCLHENTKDPPSILMSNHHHHDVAVVSPVVDSEDDPTTTTESIVRTFSSIRRRSTTTTTTESSTTVQRRQTLQEPISTKPVGSVSLMCGLLAGIAQAGLFNPYDRALYLSVRDHVPFLDRRNWLHPYRGFWQSIGGRALQGGLYFPAEHFFLRCIKDQQHEGDPRWNFLAGTAAGCLNACILNPISAVKYKTWGRQRHEHSGMWHEIMGMFQKSSGSIRPFFNGLAPTLARDVVFGGTYTWLRLQLSFTFELEPHQEWRGNFVAAGLATIVSGPFNYVRTIQFATRSHEKADRMVYILRDLAQATARQDGLLAALRFLQARLRIGWGTARVAFGMSFAHAVYNGLHEFIKDWQFPE
jgi:hypothetical protein